MFWKFSSTRWSNGMEEIGIVWDVLMTLDYQRRLCIIKP